MSLSSHTSNTMDANALKRTASNVSVTEDLEQGRLDKKIEVATETAVERDSNGVAVEDGIPVVRFVDSSDPRNPLNFTLARKWIIIFVVSLSCVCVTCCSSMVSLTYKNIERDFHIGREVATLGLSLFVLGLAVIPILVGPLSETVGRNPVYITSFILFVIFNLMAGFSNNIVCFLFARFFAGSAGSAYLSVAAGTVADLFTPQTVGAPMAFNAAAAFLGPVLGPIMSGFINQHLHWRWTWHLCSIWGALSLAQILLFVPETYAPKILRTAAVKLRKSGLTDVKAPNEINTHSLLGQVAINVVRPFQILALEPMALILCMWTSLLLGIMYMFFSAFGIVYQGTYHFNLQCTGLSFTGIGIGIVIASSMQPLWAYYYKRATAAAGGLRPAPEEHLRRGMAGAILCPISLFWFAFTTYPSIHWAVSMVSTVFFGMGMVFAFQSVFVYLVDAFRPVSASAMSANSLTRCGLAAAFPLFTTQMFHKLGNHWAVALCAFMLTALAPFPFLFYKIGHKLRKNSRFANKE